MGTVIREMKKVMILANNDVGLYQFRKELIEALLQTCEVHIVLPAGDFVSELTKMGCVFHETAFDRHGMNPVEELKLLRTYKQLLRQVKPDIVFSYTIKPNIYGAMACKALNIPCVANITGLGTAVENGGITQKITVTLYKIAFARIRKVFFQNTDNMQFFVDKRIALGKHDLLPGSGVNLQRFVPQELPPDEPVHFAFISRIMKEKGADQYLDAAEYITAKYPGTVFHVCGYCEQAYEERLRTLHDRGVIVYHGLIRNVPEFLRQVHCVIHPTYYPEGMSNVLLESCASARPIITTDRPGCREIIDDTVNGYVCAQQDSADLIEKVERFLALPPAERKQMGENGRHKVEREFDRNIVVNKYLAEMKEHG